MAMIYDKKELVSQYINQILNAGNIDKIEDFISRDYTEVYRKKRYPVGIEGARRHILGVRETYPDIHLEIDQQFTEGDWVITAYTMTGTHNGVWMNIKPTGKKIEVTGLNVDKVVDGKIVEHSGAANMFEGLLEIGAIKLTELKK